MLTTLLPWQKVRSRTAGEQQMVFSTGNDHMFSRAAQ
jgi:hypothetical protein